MSALLERHRHLFLHGAGVVDVSGDVEELGARVTRPAEPGEPGAAATADRLSAEGEASVGGGMLAGRGVMLAGRGVKSADRS